MGVAANVSLSKTNDAEFIAAAGACSTMDEWASALYSNPNALGLGGLTDTDVFSALVATCMNAKEAGNVTPVCTEAEAAGYLN